jgi:hypothetical protein
MLGHRVLLHYHRSIVAKAMPTAGGGAASQTALPNLAAMLGLVLHTGHNAK